MGKAALDHFLCCFTQKRNGQVPTFDHSRIDGGLNAEIYAENSQWAK